MLTTLLALAGAILIAAVTVALVFVVSVRAKAGWALGTLIWLTRRVFNPRQLRTAGQAGTTTSVIRHRGRTSGTAYETPVGVVPTDDGFLIALPYGNRSQWLRNVLASGSATVVHDGLAHEVEAPEVIPMSTVIDRFPPSDQRSFRLLAIEGCLRVRRVPADRARSVA